MITWDDKELKLNNDSMDNLHREFIDIYNQAFDGTTELATAFENVIKHTKEHFAFEEKLMETFDYSNKQEHINEHKKALHEMQMFYDKGKTMFGKKLMEAYYKEKLPDWFKMHLRNMDSDFHMQQVQKGVYTPSN